MKMDVILGKLLILSEPQFLHLQSHNNEMRDVSVLNVKCKLAREM